jgi:murein L,D-transpeptidase YcbB/YkuD
MSRADPKGLRRNKVSIVGVEAPARQGARSAHTGSMEAVSPQDVDWDNADSLKTLMFRQLPGGKNALGRVKFLFPNEHEVSLHDTPADALFARTGRAFSHGCVRVEEPETLAKYLLRGDETWNEPRIRDAMNAGVEKAVKLRVSIPVHIVYFTATVDENGGLHLLNDVYGYDTKQSAQGAQGAQGARKSTDPTRSKKSRVGKGAVGRIPVIAHVLHDRPAWALKTRRVRLQAAFS